MVDPRPLDGWRVNNSAAVFKLDVPALKPDEDADLQTLEPCYHDAIVLARQRHRGEEVLPSVNQFDGKAKQFDDGLYAALDLAYYRGLRERLRGHVDLVKALHARLNPGSPAASFLAAGLELAGVRVPAADRARWLREFERYEARSKPAGFYTWIDELKACFRFLRFFQREFANHELEVPLALAAALERDAALKADYVRAADFYRKLTNPHVCLALTDLPARPGVSFEALCAERKVSHPTVAVFPASDSRESALFEKLFPIGLPPTAALMGELIRRIRSGEIDLRPGPNSGWYDYQVYALETLLLPEKGEEKDKLVLTRAYKKRMLEAFQALLTKRRETHLRQLNNPFVLGMSASIPLPKRITPRLRVEPCLSYYLRTARAYAFLVTFLEASLGKEALRSLHGLRQGGPRPADLYTELRSQRDLFYGLYLVSCEDIGLKPSLKKDQPVDGERCYKLACDWHRTAWDDPDLSADTRVAVPIFTDANRGVTRLWATLGVRVARLKVEYVRPPHLKPEDGGDWAPVGGDRLGPVEYLIAVDEFAEVELRGLRVPTREELRRVCDRHKTKAAIVAALAR
jgi:hypothetical protein